MNPNQSDNVETDAPQDTIYFTPSPCSCCGSQEINLLYPIDESYAENVSGISITKTNVKVAQCKNCKHEYIYPVPNDSFLSAFYSNYMTNAKAGFYSERVADSIIPESFEARYLPWLNKLHSFFSSNPKPSVLDVGSGLGMFLRLAKKNNFRVHGIEPNLEAAEATREYFDIPVDSGLFDQIEMNQTFDVITMWDLLEHLPNPNPALKKAKSLLNNNGILVLDIPISDSLLHWLAKGLFKLSLGKIRRPLHLVCGIHHLNYFSEKNIKKLLNSTGFEVVLVNRGETQLNSLYKNATNLGLFRLIKQKLYNYSLFITFSLARLIRKQNKLIVFAKKL